MIFADESIQNALGYICVALAYCPDSPDADVRRCLTEAGLTPERDEYKSGARMQDAPDLQKLRVDISGVIQERCTLAVYVAPIEERPYLAQAVVDVASRVVQANGLKNPQDLFLDQGILGGSGSSPGNILVHSGCDSRSVLGIQLADHAAYHCSYMLKSGLTGLDKSVVLGDAPHPYSGEAVDLEWLIRLDLRRKFFMDPRDIASIKGDDWVFNLAGYGAFFSPGLSGKLDECAKGTFGSTYLGCIL